MGEEERIYFVRKYVTIVEETYHDGGPVLEKPQKKGAALAVVKNPCAGRYVEDLSVMDPMYKFLGRELTIRLIQAMGIEAEQAESYGKGVIVGEAGEIEHGGAMHAPMGYTLREVLGGAKAIVPSTEKVAGIGARLDVPMHYKDASYVRSHFDTIEIGVNDAPAPDEIVAVIVLSDSGRPYARSGGLRKEDVKVGDGQK
ncbi:MAG: amino acid synthesis family protein [Candidatus Tectomicrobia bacterium]|uniref:Amino acid synthesis family protein n=1 Tax=Tectimicrobiota bacterium TaxID=2528274 RepID=A0A932GPN9_UNCTE|nr:amino acid synthesis family protein [Candidatus Tectomicrobia bacterium]